MQIKDAEKQKRIRTVVTTEAKDIWGYWLQVIALLTSGFAPTRSDNTLKVKVLKSPGTTSTTEMAMAGATRV